MKGKDNLKNVSTMQQALQKYFGFKEFRAGQKEVVGKIIMQQSAAAIFPTGAGKSLCYQLPAMLLPHMTLVVSPLLALMKDQVDFLARHRIPAARLDSTLDREEYYQTLERARSGELKILMVAVERFKNERFRNQLARMKTSLLVVDEAHCISEWGHNFRPDYLKLPEYRKEFGIPQVLLLTATATPQVIADMCKKFELPKDNVTVTGFYRPNLFLQVSPTPEDKKREALLKRIGEKPAAPSIVYVTLQKTAEQVAEYLRDQGIRAFPYHAGMQDEEREEIQNAFLAGDLDCVVATIAFGMGIDKEDVRRVIHFDLPKSIENYSQEIGRSGRDGQPSFCEVLANKDNISVLENFIYGDTPERHSIKKLLLRIRHHPQPVWETQLPGLSYDLDIRLLPLRTLLVYLELEKILRPKYTRFEEYNFKYIQESDFIVDQFNGERRAFVQALFAHCSTKKVWTYLDMEGLYQGYHRAERERVITALDYFSEKGWIELQSKRAVEAFDILNKDFDAAEMGEKIYNIFMAKEKHEIGRIHSLVEFFSSPDCISKKLANYFNDDIKKSRCGHCSSCLAGPASIERSVSLKPLDSYDFSQLAEPFLDQAGGRASGLSLTKFLCGISSPAMVKLKAKKLPNYGALEKYSFMDVKKWVEERLSGE